MKKLPNKKEEDSRQYEELDSLHHAMMHGYRPTPPPQDINVLPSEPELHPGKYASVGAWFNAVRERGYSVPLSMCQALSAAMDERKLAFPVVFDSFLANGKILRREKLFIFDISSLGSS